MTTNSRRMLLAVAAVVVVVVAFGGFIWSGTYNVGADDQHTRPVHSLLETMRQRSIATRASKLQVPGDLQDAARITQGSGNYNAMCMGCHLAPGMADTEMSRGLYPSPPNLSRVQVDAAEAFWVIKHGIKASGMPAWGESMDDEYIWNMAAFLQELPGLSAEQYQTMVASSGGHDHGGGETEPHGHGEGVPDEYGDMPIEGLPMEAMPMQDANTPAPAAHAHPPGTPAHDDAPADVHAGMDMSRAKAETKVATHPHPPGTPVDHHQKETVPTPATPDPDASKKANDGHDHQH